MRVACVVHAPAHMAPAREDYPLELLDIVPTVFGLVGWSVHPNFQGVDVLAQSRPPLSRRLIFLHTENPQTRTEAVVLAGRWKYLIDRLAKRETLFDLAADPTESTDVSRAHPQLAAPLRDVLRQWRRQQLAYYHFPSYYTPYYPPPPPQLTQPLPMDEPTPPK